jgi:cobalt-zinc-cadmium resistance protein CzcA
VYREDGSRYVPIRFSVRGRDPSSAVQEAQRLIERELQLLPGYRSTGWASSATSRKRWRG